MSSQAFKGTLHLRPKASVTLSEDKQWARAEAEYWFAGVSGSQRILYYEVPAAIAHRLHPLSAAWILLFIPLILREKLKVVFHGYTSDTYVSDFMNRMSDGLDSSPIYGGHNGLYQNNTTGWLTDDMANPVASSHAYEFPSNNAVRTRPTVDYIGPNLYSMESFARESNQVHERVFIHGLHLPLEREAAAAAAIRHYEGLQLSVAAKTAVYMTRTNVMSLYPDTVERLKFRAWLEAWFGVIAGAHTGWIQAYQSGAIENGPVEDMFKNGYPDRFIRVSQCPRVAFIGNFTLLLRGLTDSLLARARHCVEPTDDYMACNKCDMCLQLRMTLTSCGKTGVETNIFGKEKFPVVEVLLAQLNNLPGPTQLDNLLVAAVRSDDMGSAEFINAIIKLRSSKDSNSSAWYERSSGDLVTQYIEFKQGKTVTLLTRATLTAQRA